MVYHRLQEQRVAVQRHLTDQFCTGNQQNLRDTSVAISSILKLNSARYQVLQICYFTLTNDANSNQ